MILELPWPPTVNTYWRAYIKCVGRKRIPSNKVSDKGKAYRATVLEHLRPKTGIEHLARAMGSGKAMPPGARLRCTIEAFPPDRRKRDLDNLPKGLLDALTHAGVYQDDSLIDDLRIVRESVVKGGLVRVILQVI